jgi:hypothetical protein
MGGLSYCWMLMIPFWGLVGVVASHWVLSRWIKQRHWVIMVGAAAVWGIWVMFKTAQVPATYLDVLFYVVLNAVIFAGLSYGYFTLINLSITALRVRLLKIMYQQPEFTVSETTLLDAYHPEVIIDRRLERLQKMHQIRCDAGSGQCFLERKELAYLARCIHQLRIYLNMTPLV